MSVSAAPASGLAPMPSPASDARRKYTLLADIYTPLFARAIEITLPNGRKVRVGIDMARTTLRRVISVG